MSAIERYLSDLSAALRVRGPARRRFLRECRDHLVDAAAATDEQTAVAAFGATAEIAAVFDAEVATRRSVRSTFASVAGVLATGGSTLALIHAAATNAAGTSTPRWDSAATTTAAPGWLAVVFFVGAQIAAVAAGAATLQALVQRHSTIPPADQLLLCRRNVCALIAAGVTMFAAGAALPGQGSALLLLAGPALVCAAMVAVLRAGSLARQLEGARQRMLRPPLDDLANLSSLRIPSPGGGGLLALAAGVVVPAAFIWDRGEHATAGHALATAGIEGAALTLCFIVLGPALGLRGGHRAAP